ncbi:MAG: archaemetzincin family Zn-dependent metalloprotease [Candidatus Zixiibacteriota bacterium]
MGTQKRFPARNKIVVVPMGDIDYAQVNKLSSQLVSFFSVGVDILQGTKIPQEAFNQQRGQYYSTVILSKLELLKAAPEERMLGLVDEDLYVPSRNFVIGEADLAGKCAVVSLFRLKRESYEMLDEEKILYARLLKEVIHQLGHLWGFEDCRNPKCVMYLTENVTEVDRKGTRFCDNCIRRVKVWSR